MAGRSYDVDASPDGGVLFLFEVESCDTCDFCHGGTTQFYAVSNSPLSPDSPSVNKGLSFKLFYLLLNTEHAPEHGGAQRGRHGGVHGGQGGGHGQQGISGGGQQQSGSGGLGCGLFPWQPFDGGGGITMP